MPVCVGEVFVYKLLYILVLYVQLTRYLSLCSWICFEVCILAESQKHKLLAPKVTKYSKKYKCVCVCVVDP